MKPSIRGLAALLLLALTGCSVVPEATSDHTHYYVLTGPEPGATAARAESGGLRLGLQPVQISPYLNNVSVVVRRGTNELVYDDFARWAEPLDAGIGRVVSAQLRASPAVARVLRAPLPFNQPRDYDLTLNVLRCEGVKDGERSVAHLAVAMEITTVGDNSQVVVRRVFNAPDRAWDGRDYGTLVQALSADVAVLGAEIVAALPAKRPQPGPSQ
ncbi:MAG: membrane integrity-associated transporter subunit PqiC [Opitutales bacterium]